MSTCKGAPEDGLSVAIASLHKGKQNSRLQTMPKANFLTSTWIFWWGVFSCVLHFANWTIFCHKNFVGKHCSVKIHLLERSCLGVSLNEWCQVCGYCWVFRIFFQFFLNHSSVCRQRGWDFAGWYRWPVRRGFLLVLALVSASLYPSSPCKASENVVVLCFASRNHRFTLILLF